MTLSRVLEVLNRIIQNNVSYYYRMTADSVKKKCTLCHAIVNGFWYVQCTGQKKNIGWFYFILFFQTKIFSGLIWLDRRASCWQVCLVETVIGLQYTVLSGGLKCQCDVPCKRPWNGVLPFWHISGLLSNYDPDWLELIISPVRMQVLRLYCMWQSLCAQALLNAY